MNVEAGAGQYVISCRTSVLLHQMTSGVDSIVLRVQVALSPHGGFKAWSLRTFWLLSKIATRLWRQSSMIDRLRDLERSRIPTHSSATMARPIGSRGKRSTAFVWN